MEGLLRANVVDVAPRSCLIPHPTATFPDGMIAKLRTPLLALVSVCLAAGAAYAQRATLDPAIEKRIKALMARMTLAEKIGQLNLIARDKRHNLQMEAVKAGTSGAIMNVVKRDEIHGFREAPRKPLAPQKWWRGRQRMPASIGPSPRWSTSRGILAGVASSKALVRTPTWARLLLPHEHAGIARVVSQFR